MRRVAVFLILMLSADICGNAQDVPRLQDAYFEAEYFLLSEDYADALPYYQGIYAAMPDNDNIAFRIGLCYLNIEGKKNLAIEYLEKASVNPTAKYREGVLRQKQAPYEALYFWVMLIVLTICSIRQKMHTRGIAALYFPMTRTISHLSTSRLPDVTMLRK